MKLNVKHLALCALTITLAACGGGGKIYDPFTPTALHTFGDGLVDAGQTGKIYTINSTDQATKPIYSLPEMVAQAYGLPLKPQAQGGTAWGQGKSTVADLQTQINTRLTTTSSFTPGDLILIAVGMEDVKRETESALNGTISLGLAMANVKTQARLLVRQLKVLERAGARHIYVLPVYDMGRTPWAYKLGLSYVNAGSVATELSRAFHDEVLQESYRQSDIRYTLFSPTLRTRMAQFTNPADFAGATGITNASDPVCKPPGDVDASLCLDNNLVDAAYLQYAFADGYHPTPGILGSLAGMALDEVKNRW